MTERERAPMTREKQAEDAFNGPDEGGKMGENTPFAAGWDRQPSEEGLRIDAAIQHTTDSQAGPNSDADTLIEDPQASRGNRA